MSNPVFDYAPDFGAQKRAKPNTSNARFGDGYELRASLGINPIAEIWDLQFLDRETAEIDEIEALLIQQRGVDYFYWTPPDGATEIKVIAREWVAPKPHAGMRSISFAFEQVFDP